MMEHKEASPMNSIVDRLKSLLVDVLVLAIGVLALCMVVGLIVHLFRLFHTGRFLIAAISSCADVLSSFAWPLLIVALVILYRRQVLESLKEVPGFIRNYPSKDSIKPASGGLDDDGAGRTEGSTCSEIAGGSCPDATPPTTRKVTGEKRKRNSDKAGFEDYVLNTLQLESGELVSREVNLFSDRSYRFDGAMVRDGRIIGIEVSCGEIENYARQLERIEEFYKRLSSRDQRNFGLLYCVGDEREEALSLLGGLREKISYPVEFRVFTKPKTKENDE